MLIRFILSTGKHFYEKAKDDLIDQVKQSGSKHTFVVKDNRRFEYAGIVEEIPTFKEASIVDIKVACKNLALKLVSKNVKLASDLMDKESKEDIEQFIKNIGVPKNSSKIEKIKEIKNQGFLYGKDEAMIKVLWWEAKREALRDQMRQLQLNISPSEKDKSFLMQVLDELNKKITDSVRMYQGFPETRDEAKE